MQERSKTNFPQTVLCPVFQVPSAIKHHYKNRVPRLPRAGAASHPGLGPADVTPAEQEQVSHVSLRMSSDEGYPIPLPMPC